MMRQSLLGIAFLWGCGEEDKSPASSSSDPTVDWDEPVDRDGDGAFSDVDCDDSNPDINPSASEICDGVDNDCDGYTDYEFWDAYEVNDIMTMATDLGEIDEEWLSGGVATVVVTDLNIDNPYDEDWFTWFADDDWSDDPDVAVHLDGDDLTYYIVDLYLEEWDTTHSIASKEGFGTLSITEDDFPYEEGWFWETEWDNWYVSVRTDSEDWDEWVCTEGVYELTIES